MVSKKQKNIKSDSWHRSCVPLGCQFNSNLRHALSPFPTEVAQIVIVLSTVQILIRISSFSKKTIHWFTLSAEESY